MADEPFYNPRSKLAGTARVHIKARIDIIVGRIDCSFKSGAVRAESGRIVWQIGYGRLNLAGSNRVAKDKIGCPILSLVGCQDRAVPVGVARAMANWYGPKLEHREYADHAHWMLGEVGWEQRVDEVNAWLADQGLP